MVPERFGISLRSPSKPNGLGITPLQVRVTSLPLLLINNEALVTVCFKYDNLYSKTTDEVAIFKTFDHGKGDRF